MRVNSAIQWRLERSDAALMLLSRDPTRYSCRLIPDRAQFATSNKSPQAKRAASEVVSPARTLAQPCRHKAWQRTAAAADDAAPEVIVETGSNGGDGNEGVDGKGPGDWDEDSNGRWNRTASTILAAAICCFVIFVLRAFSKKKRKQQANSLGLLAAETQDGAEAAPANSPARLRCA